MDEVYREIAKSLREGTPLAAATVAVTRGSTPRKPGARMAIRADGSFCGTIGGGCGEAEVRSVAAEVLETGQPRLVTVDLTDPIDGDDRICGGVMEVFVESLLPGSSA
jgi:xanthine/CO dehydrogenase XdhC/CoxF family maturation factor